MSVIVRCVILLQIVFDAIKRVGYQVQGLIGELLVCFVKDSEWGAINRYMYRRSRQFDYRSLDIGLFDSEREMIGEFFPRPPASVLVLGCGSGRETSVLANSGYVVSGVEIVPEFLRTAAAAVPDSLRGHFLEGSFTELESLLPASQNTFDAVILGFGCLSYLPSDAAAVKLFIQIQKLCPAGPVLISWIVGDLGRARKRARALLSSLGFPVKNSDVFFGPMSGLAFLRHEREIPELAREGGYRIVASAQRTTRGWAMLIPAS